jgi:hypothetical protein
MRTLPVRGPEAGVNKGTSLGEGRRARSVAGRSAKPFSHDESYKRTGAGVKDKRGVVRRRAAVGKPSGVSRRV